MTLPKEVKKVQVDNSELSWNLDRSNMTLPKEMKARVQLIHLRILTEHSPEEAKEMGSSDCEAD